MAASEYDPRRMSRPWLIQTPRGQHGAQRKGRRNGGKHVARTISDGQRAARIKLVDEHMRAENACDVDATMETLGDTPSYELNGVPLEGHENIRAFYEELFQAFPRHRHRCDAPVRHR